MAVELDVNGNGAIDIEKGGTNATTAAGARANLGVDPAGTAATAVTSHETTYSHANLPTADQKAALAGDSGTAPSASNKYLDADSKSDTPTTGKVATWGGIYVIPSGGDDTDAINAALAAKSYV
jgi:hypothetical protein